jgi:hypothetical protein
MLSIGKILLLTILLLIFSIVIVSPVPVVAQKSPAITVYLDPPTINGTEIGVNNTVTINLMIRDAASITFWQSGMIFNSTLLNCTGFKEGEFLKSFGSTLWQAGTIDNTAGVITAHGCVLVPPDLASGNGRLAYLTFKVKATGVSNIHLRDVKVGSSGFNLPSNIIDVYTVVLNATSHTVVTVSNSTGLTGGLAGLNHSGFYAHAYNPTLKELSFNVTGPNPGFSNITIPKTLLPPSPTGWKVLIDGDLVNRTLTENSTHTSIYFTYSNGVHKIRITTRMSSTISLALSSTSIRLGENITTSGKVTAENLTVRPNVNVTISYRPSGGNWSTLQVVKTGSNGNYTYLWKPKAGGTYDVMASWEGDNETLEAKSNVETASVRAFYFFPVDGYKVGIETNSTISAFNFSQPLKQISFNSTTPYGIIGFSNVTIPKALLNVTALEKWKVIINGTILSTGERTVTENLTHYSIYFTYSKGINTVQITTRMNSSILMALSSNSTNLGSSVTIRGNITRENYTGRPNVNVTIQSKPFNLTTKIFAPIWDTVNTVETNSNSDYTYAWTPRAAGIYKVMANWEGDNETLGAKSNVRTLAVIQNSTISIALSSANITFGSHITISGSIEPLEQGMDVTIIYKLVNETSWHGAGHNQTDQNGRYTFTWTPDTPGTRQVKATWSGYNITVETKNYMITRGAESDVLTLVAKWTSTISIALSSTEITKGKSITISGNITAADNNKRVNVRVNILYKLSSGGWISLANVTTDSNGTYTHAWKPETDGTYYIMAEWKGDNTTFGNETKALTLTVKKAPAGIPIEILAVILVAIIAIAAIAVYFIKFRKPKGKQTVS